MSVVSSETENKVLAVAEAMNQGILDYFGGYEIRETRRTNSGALVLAFTAGNSEEMERGFHLIVFESEDEAQLWHDANITGFEDE